MAEHILLYDGTCGFCAASVQFILRHERRRSLRFAPLGGRLAQEIGARHPEIQGVDSMVWVEGVGTPAETVGVRSQAVLKAAGYLGGLWWLAGVGRIVPRRLSDGVYNFVARHRHRLLGPPDTCYVPPADTRARFLE